MSLYIKVWSSFWTHRKTARLKAAMGNDALWLVPRLWSYAAINQPDGDFSTYTADELANLIGYDRCATTMLQALHQAGFLVNGHLHDWSEHNGYHAEFAERARNAALARWEKKEAKKNRIGEDSIGQETSIASSMLESFERFWKAYPRRIGKEKALSVWKKLNPNEELVARMLQTVAWQKSCPDWLKDGGKFIPHPSTWLNRGGWDDEPVEVPSLENANSLKIYSL